MILTKIAIAATLFGCTAGLTFAQDASFSAKDKQFLTDSAQSDMAEMKLAQLALQKSNNADIKDYANQMMTDHQKLEDSSKPVAEKAGVTPPTDVNAMQKKQYSRLEGMSGEKFDQAYVRVNIMDHTKVLKEVQSEEGSTQNSDMKTLSSSADPIVSDHKDKAIALGKKMGLKTNPYPADKTAN